MKTTAYLKASLAEAVSYESLQQLTVIVNIGNCVFFDGRGLEAVGQLFVIAKRWSPSEILLLNLIHYLT